MRGGGDHREGDHDREGDGEGPSWLEILTQGVLPFSFQAPVPSLSLSPTLQPTRTCRALSPPGDSGRGKPRGARNRPGLEWTRSVCSAHKCGTAGRSGSAAHQL